jgi:trehalose-phosphatase
MNNDVFPAMRDVGDRVARAPHLLLGLDFDGTLTPLVDDPQTVSLTSTMKTVLQSLADRQETTVALISGRSYADLKAHVAIAGAIYAGNHGLEIMGRGFQFVEPNAAAASRALKDIAKELGRQLQHIAGAFVEDKGLTLSIHYRRVAAMDREEVWRIVYNALANTNEFFHITTGNKVYEVRPRLRWNKGTALRWIQDRLEQPEALVIYAGDDVTDEDAFAALSDGVTIKVGDSAETAAQYLLESPTEILRFLEWVDQLRPAR